MQSRTLDAGSFGRQTKRRKNGRLNARYWMDQTVSPLNGLAGSETETSICDGGKTE